MPPLTLRIIRTSTASGSFRELSLLHMQCTETVGELSDVLKTTQEICGRADN